MKTATLPKALFETKSGNAKLVLMSAEPIFNDVRFSGFITASTRDEVFDLSLQIAHKLGRKGLGTYCPEWSKTNNDQFIGDFQFDVSPGWHPTARREENHTDIKAQVLLKLRD